MSDTTDAGTTDTGTTHSGTTDSGTGRVAPAGDGRHLEGRGYTVGSFILAVMALLVIPPVHGIVGAILGYTGYRKGDPLGKTAMLCSLAAMVVGTMVAAFAFNSVT